MVEKFLEYFKTIGMTEPILQRVTILYGYFKLLLPDEDFVDVRVDEYVQDDGSRVYENICFYSKEFSVGVLDFMTSNKIIISGLEKDIVYASVEARDYDFKKATERSRLHIDLAYTDTRSNWRTSKENCDHLMEIYRKYVIPRIRR